MHYGPATLLAQVSQWQNRATMSEQNDGQMVVERRRRVRAQSRPEVVECAGCGSRIPVRLRGPLPTWCSSTCRHRAWERRRAAAELDASGTGTVVVREVVERPVAIAPERSEWVGVLAQLTRQIAGHELPDGCLRPVYEALTVAINQAVVRDQERTGGQFIGLQPHPALPGREQVIDAQVDRRAPLIGHARQRQDAAVERAARRYDARMRRRFPDW